MTAREFAYFPTKRKVFDAIVMLKRGRPLTASELAKHCDLRPCNAMSTLRLLQEYELVRFAGWGDPPSQGGGQRPALWVWA